MSSLLCRVHFYSETVADLKCSLVFSHIASVDAVLFEATADPQTWSHPWGGPSPWEAEFSECHLCGSSDLHSGLRGSGPVPWAPSPPSIAFSCRDCGHFCWSERLVPTKEQSWPSSEDSGHHRNSRNWLDRLCGQILSRLGTIMCQ